MGASADLEFWKCCTANGFQQPRQVILKAHETYRLKPKCNSPPGSWASSLAVQEWLNTKPCCKGPTEATAVNSPQLPSKCNPHHQNCMACGVKMGNFRMACCEMAATCRGECLPAGSPKAFPRLQPREDVNTEAVRSTTRYSTGADLTRSTSVVHYWKSW